MRNSSRGAVDPFIVMDVMEAARVAEGAATQTEPDEEDSVPLVSF